MEPISRSLHRTNIVFVFEKNKFFLPDNSVFAGLFKGETASGARFLDDNILQTKILDLPRLQLQIVAESSRLRVEDFAGQKPEDSSLIEQALNIYQQNFAQFPLTGFGFNFDIYYRFSDFINIRHLFLEFVKPEILAETDLRDLGVQFTLERKGGKKQETYFLKITAPLELMAHVNHHFSQPKLPEKNQLRELFEKCYNETGDVIKNLQF